MPSTSAQRHLPLWLLVLVPVLIQLPALLGTFSPDPLFFTASIGDVGKHFAGTPWIDPNVGFQGQALGKLSADQWLAGHIPWWNAYNGVGLPLAAEVQPASLFLPFVLLMHFRSGGMWLELILQIIAGLCAFAVMRRIGLSRTAALAGALVFELNGTFAWHGAPISTPVAFLPMLLLGIEQLRARVIAQAPGGWLLIAVAFTYSLYAGFPETAYIDGLFAGVWVISRLPGLGRPHAIRFLRNLCLAVLTGLLCATPLIVPFVEFLGRAYVGGHAKAFAHAALPASSLAHSLMPWLYGPIFHFDDPTHAINRSWANIGGYFTALQFFVVLLGAFLSRRWLSAALLAWMLVCLAKTFDIRPISDLVNLLPMVKEAAFFRYAPPSWEFAGAVICALAIDSLQRRVPLSRGALLTIASVAAICVSGALWLARTPVEAMLKNHKYLTYFHIATRWTLISMLAALILIALRHRWRHALQGLVLLLAFDASMAFVLPLRSGMTDRVRNEQGIAFLQKNTGLQRVYSLGPLAPNYGGFFQIAQINHNYLPISNDWLDYLRRHIDGKVDPIVFNGEDRAARRARKAGKPVPPFKAGLTAYRELGVKYILVRTDANPFESTSGPRNRQASRKAVQLVPGRPMTVSWTLPAASKSLTLDAIQVERDGDSGLPSGTLAWRVCTAPSTCSEGRIPLTSVPDGPPIRVTLAPRLSIDPHKAASQVTATAIYQGDAHGVTLLLGRSSARFPGTIDGMPSPFTPTMVFGHPGLNNEPAPTLAYRGPDMTIYQVSDPSPYFEATSDACSLTPVNRETVWTNCRSASGLLRREAYYPGWRALVDGREQPIEKDHEIFQGIRLPPGRHEIVFRFRPTHWPWIIAAFSMGLLILILGLAQELRTRLRLRPVSSGAPTP